MASPLFHARWSAIKSFRKCQKFYDYSWNQNIERKKPAAPLIRGTILGQCLDKIAEKTSYKPIIDKYKKAYSKLFKEEQQEYGDLIGECERILTNYQKRYKDDGLTYLPGKNGRIYEVPVETRMIVEGTKVKFTGHLDKMPRDKQGRIWVMDHKSHKKIPDEAARYNDLQLVTYIWLLPESGYEPASGILWDYLRTKPPTVPETLKNGSLTKRQNIDTDYETYMQAIKDNDLDPADYKEILDPLKARGHDDYFLRVPVPHPPKDMVKNMVEEFKWTIAEMIDCTKHNRFTRNMTKDCSWCSMYALCQAELRGLDSSFIRRADYKEREEDDR